MTPASAAIDALLPVQTVWEIVGRGDPAKALVKEESTPIPKKCPRDCVLVKVRAASLNPRVRRTTIPSIESLCLPAAVLPMGDSNDAVVLKLVLQIYRRCEWKP